MILLGMVGNVLMPFADLGLQGTVFEEGATVAVVYGVLLAGLGAVAWWIPKAYGRPPPRRPARSGSPCSAWLGALLASVPYGIAGFLDQPGYAAVVEQRRSRVSSSTRSSPSVTASVVDRRAWRCVGLVLTARRATGRPGDDDPWGSGQTLEWTTTSPAPHDNFAEVPTVMSPEPMLDLTAAPVRDAAS